MTTTETTSDASILTPLASLSLPDSTQIKARASSTLDFIKEFVIDSPETYALAAEELQAIKARTKKLEDQRTGITGPINQALKAINALFKGPGDLLEEAERVIKTKMLAWDDAKRREAEALRQKAEAEAEAHRKKLAAEAEQQAAEARRQQEAAQKALQTGDAAAAAVAQAAADRAQSEANTTAQVAQMVVAAPVMAATTKVSGISTSTKVDFEVASLIDLVKHVAEHPDLITLLRVDEVKLRAYVRGLGVNAKLPGVRVFDSKVISSRAK